MILKQLSYLLPLEHMCERCHLTILVSTEHLAQGAGGHFTVEAVDVDALIFVLLTHGLVGFLFWPGWREVGQLMSINSYWD